MKVFISPTLNFCCFHHSYRLQQLIFQQTKPTLSLIDTGLSYGENRFIKKKPWDRVKTNSEINL